MPVIPTVGVLIFKANKVLLVKHGEKAGHITGSYGLPAGRIELGETDQEAAVRELQEETGLLTTTADLEKLQLAIPSVAAIPRKDGTVKLFSFTGFFCRRFTGELKNSGETLPEWVAFTNVGNLNLLPNVAQVIEEGKNMNKTKISIIAAMDEHRVIGKDNKVPWHLREDLIHLKNLIKGHTIILGRKTFDSLSWYYGKSGRSMPGKLYIIVTHNKNYKPSGENTLVAHSVDEALLKARQEDDNEIFIIGGQRIFEQTITRVDKLYLTIIEGNFAGDAFFPDYSAFTKVLNVQEGTSEGHNYKFIDLTK